ncbi:MAG: PA0069 family radical SAM protein [Planctomycetaceae bacterium]|nr:PA0069 family radical SAM protein [Planctomycetaceae bacterium]
MKRHGSNLDPPNRFETLQRVVLPEDLDQLAADDDLLEAPARNIEYYDDQSESILSENQSPDIPFRYSINPYRGCIHACAYCYARPTHEYLGFNAGLDFETRIVVKRQAARLLRERLSAKSWEVEPIVFSGVTDCYQPAERKFRITRECLEVAVECRQPVGIITKNALVVRDLDLLTELARDQLVHVFVSLTTLDSDLARLLEPRTSTPAARLRAIESLATANVPVGVMTAPMIPGLNDSELPQLLTAARESGAMAAGYTLVRLPLTVAPVFEEWLRRTQPLRAEKVLMRIRETRDGALNSSRFGQRMKGRGLIAEQIQQMFRLFRDRLGLAERLPDYNRTAFRPPRAANGQLWLF